MKKIKLSFWLMIFVLLAVCPVYAGIGYSLKCSNCGLEDDLFFDSGMMMRVIANGYCIDCNKFQRIKINTVLDQEGLYVNPDGTQMTARQAEELQIPLGYVYCPYAQTKKALYPCPECGKAFVEISEDDFGRMEEPQKLYCPKCHKKTLQGQGGILWD